MSATIKHYVASVFLVSEGTPAKTLLVHHRKIGKWMSPGGHQEDGENPIENAVREVREETGIDISGIIKQPSPFDERANLIPLPDYFLEEEIPAHGDQPFHYHLDQTYIVKVPEQIVVLNTKEAHDIGWFTLEETEKLPLFENVHLILRKELSA